MSAHSEIGPMHVQLEGQLCIQPAWQVWSRADGTAHWTALAVCAAALSGSTHSTTDIWKLDGLPGILVSLVATTQGLPEA